MAVNDFAQAVFAMEDDGVRHRVRQRDWSVLGEQPLTPLERTRLLAAAQDDPEVVGFTSEMRQIGEVVVDEWGSGDPVVLVHGCVLDGRSTWGGQWPLAESGQWKLQVLNRRGFSPSGPSEGDDYLVDSRDLAEIESADAEPVHIVAHSFGGLGALLAAGAAPARVRSLTLVEPVAYTAASGDPEVDAAVEAFEKWSETAPEELGPFFDGWAAQLGLDVRAPDPLPRRMARAIRLIQTCRRPWTAQLPLEHVREAPFPKMVVSGGHSPLFERICDAVAERIDGEREVVEGSGHLIPLAGDPFNELLGGFLAKA